MIDVFAEDKGFFLFVLCGKRMLIDSLLVTNSKATFMHSSRITSNTYNSVALQSKQLEQRFQSWMQWILYIHGSYGIYEEAQCLVEGEISLTEDEICGRCMARD